MEEVRWGIIGCGAVTEVKSGPALNKIEGSTLAAVMRRSKAKAKDYAMRHSVPKWYDDADELINDADVNAVYVATPPATHAEYTIRAAGAGKCVYVEKPMALNFKQCQEMIKACEAAGVPLFVAYYRRCLPDFLKVRELVESGAVGEPRFVSIELYHAPKNDLNEENLPWRVIPEIAGGGYFIDLGSHQLDFLDYVLGPIASVTGRAANQAGLYPAEDIVSANFVFESGVPGSGLWCFTVAKHCHTDQTQIVGSKGRITFSSFDAAPVRLETAQGTEEFTIPRPEHVQQPLLQTVVDELLGRGTCPSTGITAARTSRVMDEILGNQP
ncbi:MAG TPA: Gfo/Idh/MocA family oxidoreductase [Sedimentisphaerales bacterium]|nr:Gfo/Idh/MocA family oxidoreductase [Sedimentisphaerales bacterium]